MIRCRQMRASLRAGVSLTAFAVLLAAPGVWAATVLPGPADIDRVQPIQQDMMPAQVDTSVEKVPELGPHTAPPPNAKSITFVLKRVSVEGATVYSAEQLATTYGGNIGKKISLDQVWDIANAITQRYREDGYFLSRAYVPAQEVDGSVVIRVVEGYVSTVEIDDKALGQSRVVKEIIANITAQRPTNVKALERQHLLLSDLPGLENYQGTLIPLQGGNEGEVKLLFSERKGKKGRGFLNFDNYGSRYLGPQQLSAGWNGALVPLQMTSVTGAVSAPTRELGAVNASHKIPLTPKLSVEMSAGYTTSEPGYTLSVQDIESRAVNVGVGVNYQLVRQRRTNVQLGAALDARNSHSTILGTDLSKDKVRALRLKAQFDRTDFWQGYNMGGVTLSHGIDGLGASDPGYLNLSRAGAKPDFTKLELNYKRLQAITPEWSSLFSVAGQKASGSLYSSEEFGFGGQGFGRAYDQSEITGDEGVSAGLEVRYQGIDPWQEIAFMPYGFYDIGKVWNRNAGQDNVMSASSAGAGVRMNRADGLSGSLQLAFPLTKDADTPLYGGNGANPRLGVQIGYAF